MAFCQYCGKAVAADATFCPACGKPVSGTQTQAPPRFAQPQMAMSGQRPSLASEGDRIVAIIIDTIIVGVVSLVIFIPLALFVGFFTFGSFAFLFFGPAFLVSWLLWLLYFTYFESTSGATFGKQIMRIRVVDETTMQRLEIGPALVRNILRIIDWLPFFYLIGFILIVANERKQRLGDMAARSLVVKA
jgi:uncharacterized RDD family membrane protein YckC